MGVPGKVLRKVAGTIVTPSIALVTLGPLALHVLNVRSGPACYRAFPWLGPALPACSSWASVWKARGSLTPSTVTAHVFKSENQPAHRLEAPHADQPGRAALCPSALLPARVLPHSSQHALQPVLHSLVTTSLLRVHTAPPAQPPPARK